MSRVSFSFVLPVLCMAAEGEYSLSDDIAGSNMLHEFLRASLQLPAPDLRTVY